MQATSGAAWRQQTCCLGTVQSLITLWNSFQNFNALKVVINTATACFLHDISNLRVCLWSPWHTCMCASSASLRKGIPACQSLSHFLNVLQLTHSSCCCKFAACHFLGMLHYWVLWNRHVHDVTKVSLQMGSRQSSGGSQAGPRQGPLSNEGGAARGKGHRRTASSGQGTATTGDSGPEWTEEVDQVPQCVHLSPSQCCCCLLSWAAYYTRHSTTPLVIFK